MEKKKKKKLTIQELDLEQLEGVTGGFESGSTGSTGSTGSPDSKGGPYTMNTGQPLPILA